jgi:hypothetical protein
VSSKRARARAQLVDQFKKCLLDVLKGNGELAQNFEWDDADRALIRRWADDCTDNPEFASLLETIESDARKLSRRATTVLIFQDLIWYTVTAWQTAKGVKSGNDLIELERQRRRKDLLNLADAADALAKYYRDNAEYLLGAEKLLMPLLKGVEIRLVRPEIKTTSPPPVYSFQVFQHLIPELYERQAEMLRGRARWGEPVSTTVVSRKAERRVLKAFLHRITEHLSALCGTQADGLPHRKIIAMLANICFPCDAVVDEDVRTMLTDRRARGSAR